MCVCVCVRAADCSRVKRGGAEAALKHLGLDRQRVAGGGRERVMANGERELKLLLLLLSEGSLSLSLSKSCLLVTQPKAGSTQARWRHSHSLLLSKPDLQVLFDASAAAISHVPSSHVHLRGRGMALSLSLSLSVQMLLLLVGNQPPVRPPAPAHCSVLLHLLSSRAVSVIRDSQSMNRFRSLTASQSCHMHLCKCFGITHICPSPGRIMRLSSTPVDKPVVFL